MIDGAIQQAINDGYLATDSALGELEALRRAWAENRAALRLPYIEIHAKPDGQAILSCDVRNIRAISKPVRHLVTQKRDQIARIQRQAGASVLCHVYKNSPHIVTAGEFPIQVAIEIAQAINAMAPQGKR